MELEGVAAVLEAQRETLESMLYAPAGAFTVSNSYSTNQYGEVGLDSHAYWAAGRSTSSGSATMDSVDPGCPGCPPGLRPLLRRNDFGAGLANTTASGIGTRFAVRTRLSGIENAELYPGTPQYIGGISYWVPDKEAGDKVVSETIE